jgi:DNA-binding CsgD family transcriptional regulator
MSKTIDLEKHVSISSAKSIQNIIRPLSENFNIKFFRYLKLYKNGKRIILSNIPDAIRYMYEQGQYVNLWYDGEFPQFLKEGWYAWHLNRLLDSREIEEKIENDLISLLQVQHGVTYVQEGDQFFEIFSFDTAENAIYLMDKQLLLRFIYYFKEQARKLIQIGEADGIILPIRNIKNTQQHSEDIQAYLDKIKTNRFYLGGKYSNAYLTAKEMACVKWMVKGKTAEEIAIIENIKPKTIQRHIENIKLKFNCQKQTQIIQLILNTGLFS